MSKSKKDPLRSVGNAVGINSTNIKRVGNALEGWGKNIEANLQDTGAAWRDLFSGNFNNLGNNAVRGTLAGISMGAISRKDKRRLGGEASFERARREKEEKAAEDVIKDQQNAVAAQGQLIANTVAGLVDAKRRTPGRRMVMSDNLLSSMRNNSLLTMADR